MLSMYNDNYHINENDSIRKKGLEAWYKKNIYNNYDDYIEDTIYCNNRNIRNLNGFDANGNNITGSLEFKDSTSNTDLSCANETDRFSTLNEKAKLKYKIGLATQPEMILSHYILRRTSKYYKLMSPNKYGGMAFENIIDTTGGTNGGFSVSTAFGVRPVISLKPNIEYSRGNGSMEYPYVIDTG